MSEEATAQQRQRKGPHLERDRERSRDLGDVGIGVQRDADWLRRVDGKADHLAAVVRRGQRDPVDGSLGGHPAQENSFSRCTQGDLYHPEPTPLNKRDLLMFILVSLTCFKLYSFLLQPLGRPLALLLPFSLLRPLGLGRLDPLVDPSNPSALQRALVVRPPARNEKKSHIKIVSLETRATTKSGKGTHIVTRPKASVQ